MLGHWKKGGFVAIMSHCLINSILSWNLPEAISVFLSLIPSNSYRKGSVPLNVAINFFNPKTEKLSLKNFTKLEESGLSQLQYTIILEKS